jgi:hypothetical protein
MVQDAVTHVTQTPGAHTLSLTHASTTYTGTVEDGGSFSMEPRMLTIGPNQFTITITGQFSRPGFTATVRVDQTAPAPACFYLVDWAGTNQGGANSFPGVRSSFFGFQGHRGLNDD